MIWVPLETTALVAAVPPRPTVAPARKPVPVTVIGVPPAAVPDMGATLVTVGAGFPTGLYVYPLAKVPA